MAVEKKKEEEEEHVSNHAPEFKLVGFNNFVRTNPKTDRFRVKRFHHIEFWCTDATNSARRFSWGLGMPIIAKSDLSTGNMTHASYLLRSGDLNFLFTAPYSPSISENLTQNTSSIPVSITQKNERSLEYWSTMGLVLLAGFLKHTKVAVGVASIILSLEGLFFNVPLGFLKAISVRVSNEIKAGRPEAAKFSVWVTLSNVLIIPNTFGILVYITRNEFPILFTDDMEVRTTVGQLAIYIYLSIVIGCIKPVLEGTAIAAGWEAVITYVNVGSYYFAGLPGALLLGFKFYPGVVGLWVGVVNGFILQIFIDMIIILRIQWNKEVMLPEEVVPASGGSVDYSSIGQN